MVLTGQPGWQQVLRQALRTVSGTKISCVTEIISVRNILNVIDKVEGATDFIP